MGSVTELTGWTAHEILKDDMVRYAEQFMGVRYLYGGNMLMEGGVDCSGFMCELLKSVGLYPNKIDRTAQGIYDQFSKAGTVSQASKGCLIFYGRSLKKITHVEMCVDDFRAIGAMNGKSSTDTIDEAIELKAFIKIRAIYRKDIVAIVDPTVGFDPKPVEV